MQVKAIIAHFPKITRKRFQDLEHIENFTKLKNITYSELKNKGWKKSVAEKFINWVNELNKDKLRKTFQEESIDFLQKNNKNYPKLLKEIHDPPEYLFTKGEIKPEEFCLGVVGTRKYSDYGKQVTYKIVRELAKTGITIVSGLAYGIDSFAHKSTLEVGGRTIAVLGAGIDRDHIYPKEHKNLAEKIINQNGAVISEYSPGTSPSKYTFPKRNRIISGLSHGVLVIEAPESSGALITADSALDQNREVFTIPHNITSTTGAGPNQLIKEGATPVTSAEGIFNEFHLDFEQKKEQRKVEPNNKTEEVILDHLSNKPVHVDNIVKQSELTSSEVNSSLSMMELRGVVKNLGNMKYVLDK
jgi:DNA processing protein